MHTQFRSFISLLRRYPLPIVGNLLGMSVALAAFLIIMMEVQFHRTYDRNIPNGDRLFLLTAFVDSTTVWPTTQRQLADRLKTLSPYIEKTAYRKCFLKKSERINDTDLLCPNVSVSGSDYYDLFGFEWICCDTTLFADPTALFLPESLALQHFGTTQLVGRSANKETDALRIGGVYRDFPENSSLLNAVYRHMGDQDLHEPDNWNEYCFLRLTDPNARTAVEAVLNRQLETEKFQLVPLYTLHYRPDLNVSYSLHPNAEIGKTYILLFISLVILLIAGINFTNLYAALCPLRIRSINTQKVLGSTRSQLIACLVTESTAVCAGAWLLSLPLTGLADRFGLGELLQTSIHLGTHPGLLLFSLLMALTIGLLSGVGPALYATSFQPALVLKGNFGLSPKGRNLRNLLIGIQFTAAFALFIYVLNIYQQHLYLRHSELGYHKERLINIRTDKFNRDGDGTAYTDGLKQLAVVKDVAFSYNRLSSTESGRTQWGRQLDNDDFIMFHVIQVSDNFLRVAGIAVTEGRDFAPTDSGALIFNETARRKFGDLHLGTLVNGSNAVVGFCTDFKYGHLHGEVEPLALVANNQWPACFPHFLIVRIRDGIPVDKALQDIRTYTRNFVQKPELEPEILTQLDVMDITYEKENRWMTSIVIFCALAVFICLTGVFGLTVFECEYRRKEIGIRKVLGAVTGDIIALLCRHHVWMMGISFVLAAPLAWYASDLWLQEFTYRTEILPWTFLVPLLVVAAIALLTVALQSYRTAHANPVDSLHAE